jgi:hypothetical protein
VNAFGCSILESWWIPLQVENRNSAMAGSGCPFNVVENDTSEIFAGGGRRRDSRRDNNPIRCDGKFSFRTLMFGRGIRDGSEQTPVLERKGY